MSGFFPKQIDPTVPQQSEPTVAGIEIVVSEDESDLQSFSAAASQDISNIKKELAALRAELGL